MTERARFAEAGRATLEARLHESVTSGAPAAERAAAARRLIAFDPTHEGASRALMRALADSGERAQALKEYRRCQDAIRLILDAEPSSETRALCEAIRCAPASSARLGLARHGAQDRPVKARGPTRLRIGVLRFAVVGSGIETTLAAGLAQEIASALSRFRRFDVIAPDVLQPQIQGFGPARQRGDLDYAVDGILAATRDGLRISVRLLHMSGGARPVWGETFEAPRDDWSRLDEAVIAKVAARIDPVILFREACEEREPLDATTLTLRAMPMLYSMERSTYEAAGRLLQEAVRREPGNAMATAWAAFWHVFHIGQGWTQDVAEASTQAYVLSLRATRLDPDNAEALAIYGHLCSFLTRDFNTALHCFERALRLNPNLGLAWTLRAATHCYVGEPEAALACLDRYRELAPFDPYFGFFETIYANAYTLSGAYEEAVQVGRRAVRANPDFVNGYKALLAALGHLGQTDEAAHYRALLASREPDFSIERFVETYPFQRDADRQRYAEGLRLAGFRKARLRRPGRRSASNREGVSGLRSGSARREVGGLSR